MKRLMMVVIVAAACDSTTEPHVAGPRAEQAIVHNGVPYPEVDAQIARLYAFNNCLTGLGQGYLPTVDCPNVDMTYEVASWSNEALANVFPQGFVVNATVAEHLSANHRARLSARPRVLPRAICPA